MTLLLDIAPFSPPATPDTTGSEIYQRFEADPDLMAIAVVDAESRPVALVERNAFLVRMAAQYGYALWSRRPVSHWMKTDPLVADGAMTVAEFCGQMLEERPSELLQGFIVTCGAAMPASGRLCRSCRSQPTPRRPTPRRWAGWRSTPRTPWPPRAASWRS